MMRPMKRWAMHSTWIISSLILLAITAGMNTGTAAFEILWSDTAGRLFVVVGMAYGAAAFAWTGWRLWLSLKYRPVPTVSEPRLPRLTVVVPAFNEGVLVGETLRSLAASNYPKDRLEIIVVDDGSDDDTWEHLSTAARELGDLVTPVRCAENRGKRHALYEGFRRASGDIYVTVDSDSLVDPDALAALVSPMVEDPSVAAVTGSVRVLNRFESIVPRMLAIRYVMTFDYKRAAQSQMSGGSLMCCAGALAAYRADSVKPVLQQWLHQTFFGRPARAGEDHAMTNFMLQQGLRTVYQRTARVRTGSPNTYVKLCKMFLRWGRSNVRETVHTGQFIFSDFRAGSQLGIRFNFLMSALGLFAPTVFLVGAVVLSVMHPMVFLPKLLAGCLTGALFTVAFYAMRERDREAVFGLVYAFYGTFLLAWIWPYALLTCRRSVWLTRNLGTEAVAPVAIPATR